MNNFNHKHTRAFFHIIGNFRSFPDYVQQLEMESLGKHANPLHSLKKLGKLYLEDMDQKLNILIFNLLHQGTQEICADIIASSEDKNDLEYIKAITQSKCFSWRRG